MSSFTPKARKKNILTTTVADEVVVYDIERNKASCLDGLTALVWKACDGCNDSETLLKLVRNAGYQDATEQLILLAIDQLDQVELLENTDAINDVKHKNFKRREMFRLLGKGATAALPLVSSITVQPAIAQVSCSNSGSPCSKFNPSACCSGVCLHIHGFIYRCS